MDELNQAYEALQKAHDAGDVEGAKQIAAYAHTLETQQAAPAAEPDPGIPLAPAGAAIGASLGAAASPLVSGAVDTAAVKAAQAMAPAQKVISGPVTPQAVKNWLATQTSQPFAGGDTMEKAHMKAKIAAGEPIQSRGSNIGIRKGNLGITNQAAPQTLPQKAAANILQAEKLGTPGIARRMAGMGVTGAELGSMIEEAKKGHYGHAAVSGLGALSGAASQSRIKPIRVAGTIGSLAIPALQHFVLPDEEPVDKAVGGQIKKLAGGGQPELGEARAYEPSYSEKIRDMAAKVLSPEQADAIFGGPRAQTVDKLNPLSWAAQTPGAIADAATGFVKSSKEGDYLGAMGNYLSGALNVAPMIKPAGQVAKTAAKELGPKAAAMAEDYLTKIGGIAHAVPPGSMRMSEALAPHEGKFLGLTQTDNFGVHGERMGGNQFPAFQHSKPLHAQDQVVWMNDSKPHAQSMIDASKDKDLIWSTYIGAPDQLKSNKTVFNDIMQQHYARDLTPEQIDLINRRIATHKVNPKKPLTFPESFDIRDRFATQELGGDTFAKRAVMADMLGLGEGVGGTKKGIALPQYQDILRSHRDPLTEGVGTSSVGTRLFSVDPTIDTQFSQAYHPDYNWTVHGQDTGASFAPVPHSAAVPDWYQRQFAKTGLAPHGNSWFNYMKEPQHISEDYLTKLQKAGHKKGGKVKKK